jgi:hypothetical protein
MIFKHGWWFGGKKSNQCELKKRIKTNENAFNKLQEQLKCGHKKLFDERDLGKEDDQTSNEQKS